MSVRESEHKVYMYSDHYQQVCNEVYQHQNIETGGNLFGLWTTTSSAVIHVLLGPGQGCRRTFTSFHQDIEYMKRVGHFVNEGYMLCHIGEWHSHHTLSLNKPSSGDEQTVRRNFPQGMSKFLVIIANIVERGTRIVLSPYFFTDGGTRYEKAECVVLKVNSPFSNDGEIMKQIEQGAEGKGYQQNETTLVETADPGGSSSRHNENPRNTGSNHNGSTCPTYSQVAQSSNQVNPSASDSQAEPMDTSNGVVFQYPTRDCDRGKVSPSTSAPQPVASPSNPSAPNQNIILHPPTGYQRSISDPEKTTSATQPVASPSSQNAPNQSTIRHPPADYNGACATPVVASSSNHNAPDQNENKDDTKPTKQEIMLKKVHDELKEWFGKEPDARFEFKSSKQPSGGAAIEIKFRHDYRFWIVRIPGNFPVGPAKLFCNGMESCDIVEPLTDHVNILLSIKKRCMKYCKICEKISEERLAKSATIPATATAPTSGNVRREDILKELTNELNELITLATQYTLTDEAQSDGSNKIIFQHNRRWWLITLPAEFPNKPAEVGVGNFRYCARLSVKPKEQLNSASLIISAIKSECR